MMDKHCSPAMHTDHVLLVEDEPVLRELAAAALADAGYRVTEAGDGSEGLRILRSDDPIDLLLSDIRLPGPDGYVLAETGHTLRPELKVILMTGYAPTPPPPELHGVVHRLMQKPFAIDSLPDAVAAALGVRAPNAP